MIDYHSNLVTALSGILDTHHEMVLHGGLSVPCISYMENNNYADAEGDTLGYSRVSYTVKVWADDIKTIQKYAAEVDQVLRPLGWKRTSCNELYDQNSSRIQKIMTYEALGLEEFIGGN